MFKFAGYIPKEPDPRDGFFKVGLAVSEYLKQSKIDSLLVPREKLIGQTVQINEGIYKVHAWEYRRPAAATRNARRDQHGVQTHRGRSRPRRPAASGTITVVLR